MSPCGSPDLRGREANTVAASLVRATGKRQAQDGEALVQPPGIHLPLCPHCLLSVLLSANLSSPQGIMGAIPSACNAHCWAERSLLQGHLQGLFRMVTPLHPHHYHNGVTISIVIYVRPAPQSTGPPCLLFHHNP